MSSAPDGCWLACAWLGTNGLAVGGPAGLYLFDFLADAAPATAGH